MGQKSRPSRFINISDFFFSLVYSQDSIKIVILYNFFSHRALHLCSVSFILFTQQQQQKSLIDENQ